MFFEKTNGFVRSLKELHRKWWHPELLWYKIRCWAFDRYTTVKPRYLNHEWCDRDYLMVHMMFEILSLFIEEECSPGHIEWYGEDGPKIEIDGEEHFVRDELQAIYDWWHLEYNGRYDRLSDNLWGAYREHSEKHANPNIRRWGKKWDSKESYKRALELIDRCEAFDLAASKKREEMMGRLLNVRTYMWT